MKILTIGDSWTYGTDSSDPATKSWPAQMANKYNLEVINLARGGNSNQRAIRIGLEEICRDSYYDYIIWPLAPGSRTEILKSGKWHQMWPRSNSSQLDKIYTEFWTPWNDVQITMLLVLQFALSMKSLGIPLYVTGLSFFPSQYKKEMSWINEYRDDFDFNGLGMPLTEWDIGIADLDRKLKSLRAINKIILDIQPDCWFDVVTDYLSLTEVQLTYGYKTQNFKGHPDDNGYHALADFFAGKIGLNAS